MTEEILISPTRHAFKESLKEVGRYLISVGVVDVAITVFGLFQSMINTQTGEIVINWSLIWAVTLFGTITSVVRALDKFKYEYTKNNPRSESSKGIIPF